MNRGSRWVEQVTPEVSDYREAGHGLRIDLVGPEPGGTLASLSVPATVILITELVTAVVRARHWPNQSPAEDDPPPGEPRQ